MATAQQFLDIAQRQLGVGENPPGSNRNKFTEWFGVIGAWCAMFQSWCFAQVGMEEVHTAWCDDFITNGSNGRWGTLISQYGEILPGDLAIFDWDGGSSDHVAAVLSVGPNGQWTSIEGNWGDRVTNVTRGRENIRTFFRPHYSGAQEPSRAMSTNSSQYVKLEQYCLNIVRGHLKQKLIAVDGISGPETAAAVKDFQKFCNGMYAFSGSKTRLDVDGIYGPQTAAALAWWAKAIANPKPSSLPVPPGVPNLAEGHPSGDAVRQLQTALNRILGIKITVDGEFGPVTKAALMSYQRLRRLTIDGIYGPITAAKMKAEPKLKN